MRTRLFEWAEERGMSVKELAEMLGYSWRQVYRISIGEYPVTEAFVGRVVLKLGDWARSLFFTDVSEDSDRMAEVSDELVSLNVCEGGGDSSVDEAHS